MTAGASSTAPRRALGALEAWVPAIASLRSYQRTWLRDDVVAGLILFAMLVPAGMGYAEASGLPSITGLYTTAAALIAYAIVGPSRILVVGPDSALAALIAAAILPLAGGDQDRAIALAGALAVLVAATFIIAGLAKLGFLTQLLSGPVRYGYMNGIALTVLVGQLPKLFGFSVSGDGLIAEATGFVQGVLAGETVPAALAIGLLSLALILGLKAWFPRFPGILLAVVLATIAVSVLGLADRISVVGEVPRGFPLPALPLVGVSDLVSLVPAALVIAIVAFADTATTSRSFAARNGYEVDQNHEVVALGVANAAAGLFQGFPLSTSASRTAVAESARSRTQLTGVVGAAAIVALLVLVPGLLSNMPSSALAAVVIAAVIGVFEIVGVRKLYRLRPTEFALSMTAFAAVALLGVLIGIVIAVVLSLAVFIERAWRPHDAVLGRPDGVKGYHDVTRYPAARQIPGLVLFRWDAPLFFANADLFRDRVRQVVAAADPPARWVIIASEPITDVDTTAADMLQSLHDELEAAGVEIAFAEMKDPVADWLRRYGLAAAIGGELFFPTVGVAVKAYLAQTGVEWVDWEDRP